jgi:hypothetical protein
MPPIDDTMKHRIEEWVRKNGLNEFGDKPDTVYAGGTPLFNEMTGRQLDRYEYILNRHPELRES